jgi:hypothetical protein
MRFAIQAAAAKLFFLPPYNTPSHRSKPVRPLAQSDGHDSPGLFDELVPRHTALVDETVVRF